MDIDSESASSEALDQADGQGWQDIEPDTEDVRIISLFDERVFPSAKDMLRYCRDTYGFDIWKLREDLGLDFLDLIKLVNYIRANIKAGHLSPDVSTKTKFEDDSYLKPMLEGDALLYSLDDVFEEDSRIEAADTKNSLQIEVNQLREQLAQLQNQFTAYRIDVQRSLMENLNLKDSDIDPSSSNITADEVAASSSSTLPRRTASHHPRNHLSSSSSPTSASYFQTYAHPQIHHIMLSDTLRTTTYRDFIYMNKSLFTSRTVLDVGCGTGILSLFAAKAGAGRVVGVDGSDIVDRARAVIYENMDREESRLGLGQGGLGGRVKIVRGMIEDLSPTDLGLSSTSSTSSADRNATDAVHAEGATERHEAKFDILISEWMGYALLYESMLDSVILARNRFLSPTGMMVPSHASLKIAPLVDSNIRIEQIDFWRDVYGFDMSCMLENAFDEVILQSVKGQEVSGRGVVFRVFDLYVVEKGELEFEAPFEVVWERGGGRLEGWVVWFDMFFGTRKGEEMPRDEELERVCKSGHGEGPKAFSTGPFGTQTHWYQGICLMREVVEGIKEGEVVKGIVKYRKAGEGERGLHIEIAWDAGEGRKGRQVWKLE